MYLLYGNKLLSVGLGGNLLCVAAYFICMIVLAPNDPWSAVILISIVSINIIFALVLLIGLIFEILDLVLQFITPHMDSSPAV